MALFPGLSKEGGREGGGNGGREGGEGEEGRGRPDEATAHRISTNPAQLSLLFTAKVLSGLRLI